MRYLSLIVVVILMAWSWSLVHRPSDLPESAHIEIQQDLKRLITDYIEKNLPTSKNLKFERMWTESQKENQVRASFIYSFDEEDGEVGSTRVQIEGYAVLNRQLRPKDGLEVWSFDELHVLNNHIEFEEGIHIEPGKQAQDL